MSSQTLLHLNVSFQMPLILRPKPAKLTVRDFDAETAKPGYNSVSAMLPRSTISIHITTCTRSTNHQVIVPPLTLGQPPSWLPPTSPSHVHLLVDASKCQPLTVSLSALGPSRSKPPYLSFAAFSLSARSRLIFTIVVCCLIVPSLHTASQQTCSEHHLTSWLVSKLNQILIIF